MVMIGIALLDGYRQVGYNRWSGLGSGCVAMLVRYSTLEVREEVSGKGKRKGWREGKQSEGLERNRREGKGCGREE